jgi:hypothetical protein
VLAPERDCVRVAAQEIRKACFRIGEGKTLVGGLNVSGRPYLIAVDEIEDEGEGGDRDDEGEQCGADDGSCSFAETH